VAHRAGGVSSCGRCGGTTRQPGPNASQGANPRHARTGLGRQHT
jgi:hypothetical protein